mgnify:CR=1 FL=1
MQVTPAVAVLAKRLYNKNCETRFEIDRENLRLTGKGSTLRFVTFEELSMTDRACWYAVAAEAQRLIARKLSDSLHRQLVSSLGDE